MAVKNAQQKSEKELIKLVREKREELRSLRFQAAGSGMRDVKSIRNIKKEIAQAFTELSLRASNGESK